MVKDQGILYPQKKKKDQGIFLNKLDVAVELV